eukprot:tig00000342_g24217.t1
MAQRVAVVTGGNKGIGYAIVRGLARKCATVVLTARDETRGQAAVAELRREGLSNVVFHQADIVDQASIQRLAAFLKKQWGGIDILVCNAAIAFKGPEVNEHIARTTVHCNFFGTLNTTDALVPLVRDGGSVVVVSSTAGTVGMLSGPLREAFMAPDLSRDALCALMLDFVNAVAAGRHQQQGWPNTTYGVSKIGASALARILARDLAPRRVRVNAVHPGWVRTDMAGPRAPLSPEEGAETPLYVALEVASSGGFWSDRKQIPW